MARSEAQTRTELIDRQLAQSGWNVNDPTQVVEEFDILTSAPDGVAESASTYGSHQFSDYVLFGKDGKPLAVVEAKCTSKDAAIGREQAKQYCYNIQNQIGGELPFCFYTNGHEIFFWDLENYPPRKVMGFPTREKFFGGYSYPRNKEIMRVFRDLEIVEPLGSGIPRTLEKYDRSIFNISPNFLRVVFPYAKPFENGRKGSVTLEVTPEVRRLLAVLQGEMDRASLQASQSEGRENFRLLYLRPGLEAGVIDMTIPDKPRSSKQKYRFTKKGMALIKSLKKR